MKEHKSYQAATEICVPKSLEALGNLTLMSQWCPAWKSPRSTVVLSG